MKNLYFLLLFFQTSLLSAQHVTITQEDFNKDGSEDLLKCSYEIGSNFGGASCELTDGKTKNKFTLTNYGCFCATKKRITVTPELRKKENEYFFYTLKKEILPKFRPAPDQSLFWIISSSLNSRKLEENQYFDQIFYPKTSWRYETPELPSTYYIEMGREALAKIIADKNKVATTSGDQRDILLYYGDAHFSTESTIQKDFISVAKNRTYEILKTAHGVLVKKKNLYKWLFVTDMDINASPQKLRWASIEEVVLKDNYVIIKQGLAPSSEYNIYLIDIESGSGGKLKIDFASFLNRGVEISDLKPSQRFDIKGNDILIGTKRNKLKFPLADTKQELELLTKGN